eukprot:CAMPEP_0179195892 /NCGR_PEP_ID=MMETSP0796-20121207/97388_1 /TAXON_ID=73915 /ORGANISM="Pyrodinium bahamense, Strain pbaha01" /LENGTH=120 /DNA_ID=CAMNT_0020900265 /DNA_START=262 /DNA_END=622 /DNA_ORIENTATION=+
MYGWLRGHPGTLRPFHRRMPPGPLTAQWQGPQIHAAMEAACMPSSGKPAHATFLPSVGLPEEALPQAILHPERPMGALANLCTEACANAPIPCPELVCPVAVILKAAGMAVGRRIHEDPV